MARQREAAVPGRAQRLRLRVVEGFTLVELLVVITLIGVLLALLLPAVQGAREAARRAQCQSHLKQLALACQHHVLVHRYLPSGGWGWRWAGEPDRGFGRDQPGGWLFSLLPYLEQQSLHDLGKGGNKAAATARAAAALPLFHCPSRRDAVPYPFTPNAGNRFYNLNTPANLGRCDYAANAGDGSSVWVKSGPVSLAMGDLMPNREWFVDTNTGAYITLTGVIFVRSEITMEKISDGLSATYLIGERAMDPQRYQGGGECGAERGWDTGYYFDVNRWTGTQVGRKPHQDTMGVGGCMQAFGSIHHGGFHMAFCDGSVHTIPYAIDGEAHRRLGNRADGLPVSDSAYRD